MRAADREACLKYATDPDYCRRVYRILDAGEGRPHYWGLGGGGGWGHTGVGCPACDGSGWLDKRALLTCPLCGGTKDIPQRTARWFTEQDGGPAMKVSYGSPVVDRHAHDVRAADGSRWMSWEDRNAG